MAVASAAPAGQRTKTSLGTSLPRGTLHLWIFRGGGRLRHNLEPEGPLDHHGRISVPLHRDQLLDLFAEENRDAFLVEADRAVAPRPTRFAVSPANQSPAAGTSYKDDS